MFITSSFMRNVLHDDCMLSVGEVNTGKYLPILYGIVAEQVSQIRISFAVCGSILKHPQMLSPKGFVLLVAVTLY